MYLARSFGRSCAQAGWIRATSSTTPCTSSGVIVSTEPMTSPEVGLRDSSRFTEIPPCMALSIHRAYREGGEPQPSRSLTPHVHRTRPKCVKRPNFRTRRLPSIGDGAGTRRMGSGQALLVEGAGSDHPARQLVRNIHQARNKGLGR